MMVKKWLISIGGFIVVIVSISYFLILLYAHFSPSGIRAKRNVENSEKIEVGMSKGQVLEIMGNPDEAYVSYYNIDSVYFYEPPLLSSDGIEIFIDKEGHVSAVVLSQ